MKKIFQTIIISASAAALMLASGCQEMGQNSVSADGGIYYSLGDNAATKALQEAEAADMGRIVLRSESGDSLVLHCTARATTDGYTRIAATKGTPITTDNLVAQYSGKLVVSAYKEDGTEYFSAQKLIHESQTTGHTTFWKTETGYEWPEIGNLSFWAWAPNDAITPSMNAGTMAFTYTMPAQDAGNDAVNQPDLVVAQKLASKDDDYVDLRLKHVLTGLRFEMDNTISLKVKSIKLDGVYSVGTCTYEPDATPQIAWSGFASPLAYTQNFDQNIARGTEADPQEIGPAETTFMIIPQCATGDNPIDFDMTIEIGGVDQHYTATLEGQDWEAGVTYTYGIDFDNFEFHLEVSGKVSMNYQGKTGTNNLKVKSYKAKNSLNVPVEWYMEYWNDATSSWTNVKPSALDWIDFDKTSGEGSVDGVDVVATVDPCSEEELVITENVNNQHNNVLRAADAKGTEDSPFDLSMHDIYGNENASGATTANSYVINSSGWYAIPLVYGNAIKDGEANTIAYAPTKPSGSVSNFLTPFYNSKSESINSPYIDTDLGVSDISSWSAFPLWEDVANGAIVNDDTKQCYLIDRTEAAKRNLTVESAYLVFYVNKKTLTQGNVVLAACNENGIVWSWHIWATDNSLRCLDVINYDKMTNKMMQINLGWIEPGESNTTVNFPGKSGTIRIAQQRGSTIEYSDEITVQRLVHEHNNISYGNSSPLYQWGRKDPIIRGEQLTTNEIPSARYSVHSGYSVRTVGNDNKPDIKYPSNVYTDHNIMKAYRNRWNAVEASEGTGAVAYQNKPVKTIYDPCPPGFVVPHPGAFDGFMKGDNRLPFNLADDGHAANNSGNFNNGYSLYTSKENIETIFFPACGFRNSGSLSSTQTSGYYWTAVLLNYDTGGSGGGMFRVLGKSGDSRNGVDLKGGYFLNGFSIRPIKE